MGRGGSFESYRGTRGQRPTKRSASRAEMVRQLPTSEKKYWCPNCGLLKIKNLTCPQCPNCGEAIKEKVE